MCLKYIELGRWDENHQTLAKGNCLVTNNKGRKIEAISWAFEENKILRKLGAYVLRGNQL